MFRLLTFIIIIIFCINLVNSQACTATKDCPYPKDAACYSLIACESGQCVYDRIPNCCTEFLECFNQSTSCKVVFCNFETKRCQSIDNCTTTTTTTTTTPTTTSSTGITTSFTTTPFTSYSGVSTSPSTIVSTGFETISNYLSSGQTTFTGTSGEGQYAGPLYAECLNCIDINCFSGFGLCKVIPIEVSSKCRNWKPKRRFLPTQNNIIINNEDGNTINGNNQDSNIIYYSGSTGSSSSGNNKNIKVRHPKLKPHECCPYIPTCF